jgi:hypothetical protein
MVKLTVPETSLAVHFCCLLLRFLPCALTVRVTVWQMTSSIFPAGPGGPCGPVAPLLPGGPCGSEPPVPESVTLAGLDGALLTIDSTAVRGPSAWGAKLTVTWQLEPAASPRQRARHARIVTTAPLTGRPASVRVGQAQ